MPQTFLQEGIILKKIPYSEADEIVTVLMQDSGVRRLFVPGARKSRRRFAGRIDVFADLRLEYSSGVGTLYRLNRAEETATASAASRSSFAGQDLRAYAFFNYLAELICEFTPEEIRADDLFTLWRSTRAYFELHPFTVTAAVAHLIRVFTSFGYAMTLDRCAACSLAEWDGESVFVPEAGGVLCPNCMQKQKRGHILTRDKSSQSCLLSRCDPFSLDEDAARRIFASIVAYAHVLLQKRTRAESFLLAVMG